MTYGRGGAGNLQQQSNIAQQLTPESRDVEANRQNSLDAEEEMAKAEAHARARRESDPYAHTGRGGAGNWFSPRTLAAGGTFVNTTSEGDQASTAALPESGKVRTASIPGLNAHENRKMGRGGAGNFVWETERERQQEVARKEKEQAISHDALRDVESGLAKPGRAVLKHETVKEADRQTKS